MLTIHSSWTQSFQLKSSQIPLLEMRTLSLSCSNSNPSHQHQERSMGWMSCTRHSKGLSLPSSRLLRGQDAYFLSCLHNFQGTTAAQHHINMDCVWVAMETSSLRQTLPDKKTSVHLSMERKSWNVQFHELAKHVKQKT